VKGKAKARFSKVEINTSASLVRKLVYIDIKIDLQRFEFLHLDNKQAFEYSSTQLTI
jgi:hypothetical protein